MRGTNIALRTCGIAAAIAVSALLVRLPSAAAAGQLLGVAAGVLVIIRERDLPDGLSTRSRLARALAATTLLAVKWWIVPAAIEALGRSPLRGTSALIVGALPIFVALTFPAVAPRVFRVRRLAAA